jgi:hypothetical protein
MRSIRFGLCALGVMTALIAEGCIGDPVRTTAQAVHLHVATSATGDPVDNARVSLKWDYDGNVPPGERRPEAERPTYEWFSSTTGEAGETIIPVSWTMLDRSLGQQPPAWRDQVAGEAYLVRVEKNQVEEVHSLVIKPGAQVKGRTFTVRVVGVGEPRYVKTE